jgi:hypothetical protein
MEPEYTFAEHDSNGDPLEDWEDVDDIPDYDEMDDNDYE